MRAIKQKENKIQKISYKKPKIVEFGQMKGLTKGSACGGHDGMSGSGKSVCI